MNRIDRNFCMLDGQPCTRCNKCEYMPVSEQSGNWVNKLLIAIILALLFLLLLSPLLTIGYNVAIHLAQGLSGIDNAIDESDNTIEKSDNIIEESNHHFNGYDNNYGNYPPPRRYYNTDFYIYDYPNNPATCGGGNCPTSEFGYV